MRRRYAQRRVKLLTYRGRQAATIENDRLRVTVMQEGGHIAAITHLATGVNPLWTPPWPSIEPSTYAPAKHPEYGGNSESKLLAGIMGHNLCLDLFGAPTPEEAAAGISVHGEANVVRHTFQETASGMTASCRMPGAQLDFSRRLTLNGDTLSFEETVTNLAPSDRPVAWTQHVTLGPPFIERGVTKFEMPGTRCRTFESDFTEGKGKMAIGKDFDWPNMPGVDGKMHDLTTYWRDEVAAGFATVLMDPHREEAYFHAGAQGLTLTYRWKRSDFPWLGIWDECHARTAPPWNGRTITRGLEFGASPFPESRRAMIDRKELFGVPGYRWIPAKTAVTVRYSASLR